MLLTYVRQKHNITEDTVVVQFGGISQTPCMVNFNCTITQFLGLLRSLAFQFVVAAPSLLVSVVVAIKQVLTIPPIGKDTEVIVAIRTPCPAVVVWRLQPYRNQI